MDSDPRKTALARASSIYKRQTRPRRQRAHHKNKTVTVKTVMSPRWGSTPGLTDRQSQCDMDLDLRTGQIKGEQSGD
jgi:hypothetical protein